MAQVCKTGFDWLVVAQVCKTTGVLMIGWNGCVYKCVTLV